MRYFSEEDLIRIAGHAIEPQEVKIRELGLLSASAHRPQTFAFGYEPYPTVPDKAAALLVSLALNHCLVDGNKRLALSAGFLFCRLNTGRLPDLTNDEAYDLVILVCEHEFDVPQVADVLRKAGIPDEERGVHAVAREAVEAMSTYSYRLLGRKAPPLE